MDTCAGRFFDVKRYAGIVGLSGSKLHPQAKDACLQAGDSFFSACFLSSFCGEFVFWQASLRFCLLEAVIKD